MDEIEKGIAADSSDGGTSKRVLGTLLTWMAEKTQAVFIVATANDISALPPELVRKGRFDEIFFVDLPNKAARAAIIDIHLNSRKQKLQETDIEQLADLSVGFSGAELEQAIVSALYSAKAVKLELNRQIISEEIKRTKPLSIVMSEKIAAVRAWAADRTVPAD
jgi:SpoVK/Ycf46/Vps4 family AAA+-type ATPase